MRVFLVHIVLLVPEEMYRTDSDVWLVSHTLWELLSIQAKQMIRWTGTPNPPAHTVLRVMQLDRALRNTDSITTQRSPL